MKSFKHIAKYLAATLTICRAAQETFGASINVGETLNYTEDATYAMAVNFGTPPQRVDGYTFVIDTTISTLITSTAQCTNCTYHTFDMAASQSLTNVTTTPETMKLPSG